MDGLHLEKNNRMWALQSYQPDLNRHTF